MNVQDSNSPLMLLMGHVSLVNDMLLTPDGKYIITADRDEKIRVTHYTNAFEIQSFCLGHTKWVFFSR